MSHLVRLMICVLITSARQKLASRSAWLSSSHSSMSQEGKELNTLERQYSHQERSSMICLSMFVVSFLCFVVSKIQSTQLMQASSHPQPEAHAVSSSASSSERQGSLFISFMYLHSRLRKKQAAFTKVLQLIFVRGIWFWFPPSWRCDHIIPKI